MAAVPKEVEQKIARAPSKAKETKAKAPKPKLVKVSAPAFTDFDTGKVIKGLPAPMPCPFCKHPDHVAVAARGERNDEDEPAFIVECGYCGAESPYGKSQLEAAQLWNGALGGVDLAHKYRLDNLSLLQRRILVRGLKVVLDNANDEEFKEAEFLSNLLADFSPPAPKKKQFIDIDDSAPIPGLPEPEPCPFCGFHEWTGIVTKPPVDAGDIATYHVQCDGCFAEGSPKATKLEAAQHWNKAARKVDYSVIEALDSVTLTLTHLSDALVLATSTLRHDAIAENGSVAACLESAIDAKLEPAREQLDQIMQQLSSPQKNAPKFAMTG